MEDAFAGKREEEIYDLLIDDKRAAANFATYAGPRRGDLIGRLQVPTAYKYQLTRRRDDWENLLAEGIRRAVVGSITSTRPVR